VKAMLENKAASSGAGGTAPANVTGLSSKESLALARSQPCSQTFDVRRHGQKGGLGLCTVLRRKLKLQARAQPVCRSVTTVARRLAPNHAKPLH
jgi:hypothetical protein